MKVSELIAKLEALKAQHGDLDVQSLTDYETYTKADPVIPMIGIGYVNKLGDFMNMTEGEVLAHLARPKNTDWVTGPFVCIGSVSFYDLKIPHD